MKKVILLALLIPLSAKGQILENFEPGNLNNWVQSTADHWKADGISSLSGSYSLHHVFDNPDAGTDRIGIRIKDLHPAEGLTRWSFLVRYGYDPSSQNNWSVFLMSDIGPEGLSPDGAANGYAIGVNLTGSDDTLRLWKVKGNQITSILNCRINWQTDAGITAIIKITVERSQSGTWNVSVFRSGGKIMTVTSGNENELFPVGWFGIYYKYSSTRDRLLWLDDISIEGVFYEDNEAPFITSCHESGMHSADITFNEEPANDMMLPENYSLNVSANKASSVNKLNNLTYRIIFSGMINNKSSNSLVVNNICDLSGNCARDVKAEFTPFWAETGDVIISEIMADPVPEVSLPGTEYIEISNRTGFSFNLKNWKLLTEDQEFRFPECTLAPSDIMILCALPDISLYEKYGSVTGMKQFPTLTDGGRLLALYDSSGVLIHGIEYSSKWYRDDLKSRGGWSLEIIDSAYPFSGEENWTASESKKGGTPGTVNSVSASNPDTSFHGLQNVFPDDSITLNIRFLEPVFSFQNEMNKIKIDGNEIKEVHPADPLLRVFTLKLAVPLPAGTVRQLEIPSCIADFAGNEIQNVKFSFGLTQQAGPGEILFNEILFNPLPGDQDYLELYNCSDKIFDASRILINSVNDVTGDRSETVVVSDKKRCILPGSYYAISIDTKKVSERYFSNDPENLHEVGSLPSMADDKGHLILFSRELDLLDEVLYTEKMHFTLLSSFEGVALEKIMPQNNSKDATNWHSASESSGWGTPGRVNSVYGEMPSTSGKVEFSSSKITPDNNGSEDFLTIRLSLQGRTNVVSVTVFDEAGNFMKKLATNLYAGSEASIIWDGTADDGSLVNTGIYIVLISVFDDTGKTNKWKKVCTVIRNSN